MIFYKCIPALLCNQLEITTEVDGMKCINCGSEWTAKGSYSQVRSCPFCGESLTPLNVDDKTLDSVLKSIFDQFGTNLLLDCNKFIAVFVDMAPKFKQEKKIIAIALNENIAPLLLNADREDEIIVLEKITTKLNEIMAPSAIRLIVSAFLPALGWSINPADMYSAQQEYEVIDSPKVYDTQIRTNTVTGISEYRVNDFTSFFANKLLALQEIKSAYKSIDIERIKSEFNDLQFQQACNMLNADNYQDAISIFTQIYKDNQTSRITNSMAGIKLAQMHYWGEGFHVSKTEAFKILISLINCNNPLVIAWLSDMYRMGIWGFVEKDLDISQALYNICMDDLEVMAKLGSSDAQYFIAFDMLFGKNRETDEKIGFYYAELSAKSGNIHSISLLADCYIDGSGCSQDMSKGISIKLQLASSKSAVAQYKVGMLYYNKKYSAYLTQDFSKAFNYFMGAAELDHVAAQNYLGDMYYYGYGVVQDYDAAFYWYKLSADAGNKYSCNQLGDMYLWMEGTVKDLRLSFQYHKTAADLGVIDSQYRLHVFFFSKDDEHMDYELGRQYLEKAAKQEHIASEKLLARCYLTPDFGFEDERLFVFWMTKAAEHGDAEAQRILGESYIRLDDGILPKDYKKASYWLYKAAEQNDFHAMILMAEIYSDGEGLPIDTKLAIFYLDKAEKLINKDVSSSDCENAAKILKNLDNTRYTRWLNAARKKGSTHACCLLAYYYINEKQMYEEGFEVLMEAHEKGDVEATRLLGMCYKNGIGVKKDKSTAKKLLRIAADAGDKDAAAELKKFLF